MNNDIMEYLKLENIMMSDFILLTFLRLQLLYLNKILCLNSNDIMIKKNL